MLNKTTKPATAPVHMLPINELYLASEAPKGVNLMVRDSGRGSPLTDEELKASIYNNGIIHALIWKEHADRKYVVAGNRRLRFLREIFADAMASPVQTQNVADFPGDWRDVAMDTNLSLPPHLVERYEMIVAIAKEEKLPEAEVCARYGMSSSQYRRVMALGRMAPVVRAAWKASEIDAKTAQRFTLEPDAKEQERIFESLKKNGGRIDEWDVRQKIVPTGQREVGQMVAFVGVDAVRKAKLLKQEDLFGADHIVTDVKGLKKLVGDKMAKVRDDLLKAGWSWALPSEKLEGNEYAYSDVHPDKSKAKPTAEENARLKEIGKLLDSDPADGAEYDDETLMEERERIEQQINLRGFAPAQMARSGCIIKIGHRGELEITYGKVKPAEKAKVAAAQRRENSAPGKPKPKPKPGQVVLTNALAERLSGQLEKAIAHSLTKAPHVAVAAIIAGFASSGEVVNVDVGKQRDGASRFHSRGSSTKQFEQTFEGALKATPEQRAVMLAAVAAGALDIVTFNGSGKQPADNKGLQDMIAALPFAVVANAIDDNFDAADYFNSVTLGAIVEAVRCSMGEEHAAKVAKMKRKDAAKFAAGNLKQKGYLPPALRTAHYKGPTESAKAKAAPAKKAAKKKK